MKMMNSEEGFYRIGVATLVVSMCVGLVTAFLYGNLFVGLLVATGLGAFLFLLLRLIVYVIKGFMKENSENENVD